jgi:hypothetical protein
MCTTGTIHCARNGVIHQTVPGHVGCESAADSTRNSQVAPPNSGQLLERSQQCRSQLPSSHTQQLTAPCNHSSDTSTLWHLPLLSYRSSFPKLFSSPCPLLVFPTHCNHSSTCCAKLRLAPIDRAMQSLADLMHRAQTDTTWPRHATTCRPAVPSSDSHHLTAQCNSWASCAELRLAPLDRTVQPSSTCCAELRLPQLDRAVQPLVDLLRRAQTRTA